MKGLDEKRLRPAPETLEMSSQTDKSRHVLLAAMWYEVFDALYKCFAAGCSISQGDWNYIFF